MKTNIIPPNTKVRVRDRVCRILSYNEKKKLYRLNDPILGWAKREDIQILT